MPRLIPAVLLAVLCLLPASARAQACPGADPCPYSAAGVIGKRAEGTLRFPQAAAVGPDGSIYVADQWSHAIQVFGPDGAFRREYGGAGVLTSVGGVAVASDGTVYAADGTDRIVRFAADGSLLGAFGESGSAPGEFHFGAGGGNDSGAGGGLAISGASLYVADTRNDRIQRFALDGSEPVVIVPPGRLGRPQGLAVHGSRIVVADDTHHRLAVFDTGGRFIRNIGAGEGPQPGELQNPYDVAIDPQGRIYVADNSNHRVTRYGPAPGYVYRARWGAFGSAPGHLQYPRGISVDGQARTYVADPGGNRIDVFDSGGASLGSLGGSGRVRGQFIAPIGVGADASGMRAVTDSVNGRVQLLNPDGSVAAMFGAPNPGPTLLPDPVAVAFDGAGNAYVLDQQRSRVLVFDRAGRIIRTIGSRGSGPGKLLAPSALAVSGTTVFVGDTGNGRIARFSVNGTYFGSSGNFRDIRGIAVSADGGTVYASDAGTNRVYVQTASGQDLAEIGRSGTAPGRLRRPEGVALDAAGNVWVANTANDRVEAFTPDGTFISGFGGAGSDTGQFVAPRGVAVDCHGLVTVTDADNNRVQQFQAAAATPCAALAPIQNPPDPVLPGQPKPVPPQLTVTPTRTSGIFAIRQLPLRVRCDLPCQVAVVAKLTPRSGKHKPTVTLRQAATSLPAGRTITIRPRLAVGDLHRLTKALKGRRGLVADLRVTATTSDSAPTVVTRRLNLTG